MRSRIVGLMVGGLILWVVWCFYVVRVLVPAISLRFSFWPWLMSWTICLLPVIAVAAFVLLRTGKSKQDH